MKLLLVNFAGLALIVLIVWWFWIAKNRDQNHER